jgi:hypothetical protein
MTAAIFMLLVGLSPLGSPAGCHVISQKRGFPQAKFSSLKVVLSFFNKNKKI